MNPGHGQNKMYDAHCHIGFFAEPLEMAQRMQDAGVSALGVTCVPAEYERLSALGLPANIELAAGLHPWWITDQRVSEADIARAAELAKTVHAVGEIGLDFRHNVESDEQCEQQIAAFEAILDAVSEGGHVLSIHAVDAAGEVLDLLQKHDTCANNQVIFHWFSGSSFELGRARKMGCYFSVGARMLESKRGRSYATQIEPERLLSETDLPASLEDGEELTFEEYFEALTQATSAIGLSPQNALG